MFTVEKTRVYIGIRRLRVLRPIGVVNMVNMYPCTFQVSTISWFSSWAASIKPVKVAVEWGRYQALPADTSIPELKYSGYYVMLLASGAKW